MEKEFKKVADNVKELLNKESSGHDFYHGLRVLNSALAIQEKEGGNRHVIGVAALIHDICRPWEKRTGKLHFGPEALKIIEGVLEDSGEAPADITAVLEIVRLHDVYDSTSSQEKTLELKIVQDADNLDALGAIGIGRVFAFGGANDVAMYIPGENLSFKEDFVENPQFRRSTVAHFYDKLLKLKDNMNTDTGMNMAEGRHEKMVEFLDEFFREWKGNA